MLLFMMSFSSASPFGTSPTTCSSFVKRDDSCFPSEKSFELFLTTVVSPLGSPSSPLARYALCFASSAAASVQESGSVQMSVTQAVREHRPRSRCVNLVLPDLGFYLCFFLFVSARFLFPMGQPKTPTLFQLAVCCLSFHPS